MVRGLNSVLVGGVGNPREVSGVSGVSSSCLGPWLSQKYDSSLLSCEAVDPGVSWGLKARGEICERSVMADGFFDIEYRSWRSYSAVDIFALGQSEIVERKAVRIGSELRM
jgi:hypothetical protein